MKQRDAVSFDEKLALIEEANKLRKQYFSPLGYKNYLQEKMQYVDSRPIEAKDILFFINPVIQHTFLTNDNHIFQPTESLALFKRILEVLSTFQSEISDSILKRLNNLQIYFNGGEK